MTDNSYGPCDENLEMRYVEMQLEQMRKKVYRQDQLSMVVLCGFVVLLMFMRMASPQELFSLFWGLGVAVAVAIWLVVAVAGVPLRRKYKVLYKTTFVKKVLEETFENVDFRYDTGYTEELLGQRRIVRLGNRFHSEDYLSASYHGVNFQRSDVVVKQVTRVNKHTYTTIYFEGRIYELDFNKKITVGMQIRDRRFQYADLPSNIHESDRIKMENEEFNRRMEVFTTDGETAFYVLTPPMMERIIRLSNHFESININIFGNKLILALNSDYNGLEPPNPKQPISYAEERQRIMAELTEIMGVIDELNLSEQTYLHSMYNDIELDRKLRDEKMLEEIAMKAMDD